MAPSERGDGIGVQKVMEGSIAREMGIVAGDRLLSLDEGLPQDLIDWEYAQAGEEIQLHVLTAAGEEVIYEIEKDYDESLGLVLEPEDLSPIRRCQNRCLFCFLDQMPPGLRPGLYVKDDDYRSSFLSGNFITLTNLQGEDWKRIINLKLSPLYISVHAVNPGLRRLLLGHPRAGLIQKQLQHLAGAGIDLHLQCVLVPGLNDGPSLDETISFAATLYPRVQSLAVVPLGLTRYRGDGDGLRAYTSPEAKRLLDRVGAWQRHLVKEKGCPLVHMADEWYMLAQRQVPSRSWYGDYPQLENGVGLVRQFQERLQELAGRQRSRISMEVTLVTGMMAKSLLQDLARLLARNWGVKAQVLPVPNGFFGSEVNVAGLITGRDLEMSLGAAGDPGPLVLLPAVMLDKERRIFLDGVQLEELRRSFPASRMEPVEDLLDIPGLLRQWQTEGAG